MKPDGEQVDEAAREIYVRFEIYIATAGGKAVEAKETKPAYNTMTGKILDRRRGISTVSPNGDGVFCITI